MAIANISKLNKILLVLVVVLFVSLLAVVYWQRVGFERNYYAVYLSTGDLYFGQLSYSPKLSLQNAYLLQRNPNDQQNPLSLQKFENAFWGPQDKIYINDDNIIWKAKLKKDSQVVQYMKNPQAFQQPSQQQLQQQLQQPVGSQTELENKENQ